jgi:hypothetical protein
MVWLVRANSPVLEILASNMTIPLVFPSWNVEHTGQVALSESKSAEVLHGRGSRN